MNRTQKVLVGGQISDSTVVLSGVPQGTVLGSLHAILICYIINDLPRSIKSKVRMYADDTLVYIVSNSTCIQLQNGKCNSTLQNVNS